MVWILRTSHEQLHCAAVDFPRAAAAEERADVSTKKLLVDIGTGKHKGGTIDCRILRSQKHTYSHEERKARASGASAGRRDELRFLRGCV